MRNDDDECRRLLALRDSPEIWAALSTAAAVPRRSEMQLQALLRQRFPPELVRDALTLAELRRRAASKFTRADRMWFDRVGLEQATAEQVAAHKAQRFHGRIWDYCCGIGSDAAALAARGEVIAVDHAASACLRARWNAEAVGAGHQVSVVCADVVLLSDRSGLLHVDPDRRPAGRHRSVRIEDCRPAPVEWERWRREFAGGAIKLSPAANFPGKFPDCEVELISLHGECKEATLWFGELRGPAPVRATLLPSGESIAADPLEAVPEQLAPQAFVFDPDPAVVRAGLVDVVAARLGLGRLDAQEEYLTGPGECRSAFVTGFRLCADLPFRVPDLRTELRSRGVGHVEIKCRRIPVDVERLRRELRLSERGGTSGATVIVARIAGRSRALIVERILAAPSPDPMIS